MTVVTYTKPDFQAVTFGKAVPGALFGLVGGAIAAAAESSEGNALVKENDIQDPALAIEPKLAALVTQRLNVSGTSRIAERLAKLDDEASLSKEVGNKGVLLDVETINWSFAYRPFHTGHYQIIYAVRARLIDANNGNRIAQVPCVYKSEDKTPPTYDEMLNNKADLLKSMFAKAADVCAETMATSLYAP